MKLIWLIISFFSSKENLEKVVEYGYSAKSQVEVYSAKGAKVPIVERDDGNPLDILWIEGPPPRIELPPVPPVVCPPPATRTDFVNWR